MKVAPVLLFFMIFASHLQAADVDTSKYEVYNVDSTGAPGVHIIYVNNKFRAGKKMPSRPIAQTIIGSSLCGVALVSAGMGTYCFVDADNMEKRGDGLTAAVNRVEGTVYMICAGGYLIPGTILSLIAKKKWAVYKKAKAKIGFNYKPRTGAVGAIARIDF